MRASLQHQMHRKPHSGRRLLALVVAALLLGGASAALDAATAHAAMVGPQSVLRPPAHFPVEFPGRRYHQGRSIPPGHAVLRRRVSMAIGERPKPVRFVCPRRTVAFTPGVNDPGEVGIVIKDLRQYRHPRRTFRLWIFPAPAEQVKGPRAEGRIYVLCGPRNLAPVVAGG